MRPIEAGWVEAQARALMADMAVSVFKIGLTGSLENIEVIAGILSDYPDIRWLPTPYWPPVAAMPWPMKT